MHEFKISNDRPINKYVCQIVNDRAYLYIEAAHLTGLSVETFASGKQLPTGVKVDKECKGVVIEWKSSKDINSFWEMFGRLENLHLEG